MSYYDLAFEVALSGLDAPIAEGHAVTVGEAVRAYLALEWIIGQHDSGPWRSNDPSIGVRHDGWTVVAHREQECVVGCQLVQVAAAPTPAAAILAAVLPPDAQQPPTQP